MNRQINDDHCYEIKDGFDGTCRPPKLGHWAYGASCKIGHLTRLHLNTPSGTNGWLEPPTTMSLPNPPTMAVLKTLPAIARP